MSLAKGFRLIEERLLSRDWGILKKTRIAWRGRDGGWEAHWRETYDAGDGVVVLPYDRDRRCVLLVRQFRYPAHAAGEPPILIEAAAGKLDGADPETRARAEAEEELGLRLGPLEPLWTLFSTPGSVTERLHYFVTPYVPSDRVGPGGGAAGEGEELEVLEMAFGDAMAAVGSGEIRDAKTVLLLQHAALTIFAASADGASA